MNRENSPVALVTGASHRIGQAISDKLHAAGYRVIVHYRNSASQAQENCRQYNQNRANSALALAADLADLGSLKNLVENSIKHFGRLDVLINNASNFYPTPLSEADEAQWHDLLNSNVKGAYFLCQAAQAALQESQGCIINITDIHAQNPLTNYSIYCCAKAALAMMTRCLAKELAPIRVNSVAPGPIEWPSGEAQMTAEQQERLINKTFLQRKGSKQDVAQAVLFLVQAADYITGQTLHVDAGRHCYG